MGELERVPGSAKGYTGISRHSDADQTLKRHKASLGKSNYITFTLARGKSTA